MYYCHVEIRTIKFGFRRRRASAEVTV